MAKGLIEKWRDRFHPVPILPPKDIPEQIKWNPGGHGVYDRLQHVLEQRMGVCLPKGKKWVQSGICPSDFVNPNIALLRLTQAGP